VIEAEPVDDAGINTRFQSADVVDAEVIEDTSPV
jgi:hypothetical protein